MTENEQPANDPAATIDDLSGAADIAQASAELASAAIQPVAFGQLGFGKDGVKSSHTANKMDVGEGLVARQVVASVGQTHLLVDADTVKGVETWEPPTEPLPAPPSKPRGPPPKKKARK